MLFDKIAFVYVYIIFEKNVYLALEMAGPGNTHCMCQLYRHTFGACVWKDWNRALECMVDWQLVGKVVASRSRAVGYS